MTKPLPLTDFRAVRIVLEPTDFAIGPDTESPPSDLIDETTWHSIMTLPDDVVIRTSNHHGKQIKRVHDLYKSWHKIPTERQDYLGETTIDTINEFDAVLFNSTHGFYRQAIASLRSILELITIGTYCQICNKSMEFIRWRTGQDEIKFGTACDGLMGEAHTKSLKQHLKQTTNDSIFDQKTKTMPGGWARRLYSELSNFSHSRPSFTNVDLWASNGPIYAWDAFARTTDLILQTYALCFVVVKITYPDFVLDRSSRWLFKPHRPQWTKVAHRSYEFLYAPSAK